LLDLFVGDAGHRRFYPFKQKKFIQFVGYHIPFKRYISTPLWYLIWIFSC
jgi:hypothetical protein